ncbi:sensor histidine kinase [Neobacillus niacini]|uniref:sensor histidine kinase n=1 Tax=Neobacillus niacini TaxID=86668 RepID=UPI0009DCFE15|nr:HAMP domain-containing sensor histidine kinase [Neobacillus niacini]
MFKKSLRIQIVVTFIMIILISLFLSFGITRLIADREITFDEPFLTIASDAANLLAAADPDRRNQVLGILSRYNIHGEILKQGNVLPFSLTEEETSLLFQSDKQEPFFLNTREGPVRFIGVPNIDDSGSSLIVKVDFTHFSKVMQRILLISLILVLVIGSLFILLASNYIVKPVRKLTSAAKEMATGNLSVRLKYKKDDELGELIKSFNHMASELQKIDKMRADFVSNVSHEIQSPITSIRGFTKAIRDGVIPQEHQKEHLDIIYEETLRLSKLSDHLLRLASLDSENHPFHPVDYQLDEQLRRTILVSEPLWTEKNLDVELDLKPCKVKVDQDLFKQVWQNLITNAIKYSDKNDKIEVKMEIVDHEVRVHVKDTGKGIPEEDLPYVFDRFYMVDKARSRSGGGNGLGLSIVKKIIELHGCQINVKSEEGKGSCFTISIPL